MTADDRRRPDDQPAGSSSTREHGGELDRAAGELDHEHAGELGRAGDRRRPGGQPVSSTTSMPASSAAPAIAADQKRYEDARIL